MPKNLPGNFLTDAKVLGPNGEPWQSEFGYDSFDLPHVLTFQSIIGSAWRTYFHGKHDDAIRNDPEFADNMRRDPHMMRLLRERKDAVVSMKWHLETDDERNPQHKAVADGVTACIKATPRLKMMLRYLSEAVWYGKYAAQMDHEWQTIFVPDPDNPRAKILKSAPVVLKHLPVEGDKIDYFHDDTPYILTHGSYATRLPKADIINSTEGRAVALEGTWRDKFIIHKHEILDAPFRHPERAGSIHGVGIRSVMYWIAWLRKELLANILDYCERTGLGLRVWYYQGGNQVSREEVEKAAKLQTDKTNVIVPRFPNQTGKSSEAVEFQDTGSNGAMILDKIMQDFKAEIELYVIGQTLSSGTEGSGLGGTGVAGMHAQTKHNIISLDADNLAETLTMEWVRPVLGWMYPLFRSLPLRWVFETSTPNQSEQVDNIVKLFNIGVDFIKTEARSLSGMSDPQEGDETISLSQQMQQQAAMQPQPVPGDGDGDGLANEDGEPSEEDYAALVGELA